MEEDSPQAKRNDTTAAKTTATADKQDARSASKPAAASKNKDTVKDAPVTHTNSVPAAPSTPPVAGPKDPPLPTEPPRPALINLNDWDKTWEEQYERRKRRKVIHEPLPAFTIGRPDDPMRLPAGPCLCPGPCHLNDQCPCNHSGLYCSDMCACTNCENNPTHAESRHRALVSAIQKGHRPLIDECCPCEPSCNTLVCAKCEIW